MGVDVMGGAMDKENPSPPQPKVLNDGRVIPPTPAQQVRWIIDGEIERKMGGYGDQPAQQVCVCVCVCERKREKELGNLLTYYI